MAGTNYKSGLAIARSKQMIQRASKVQALQNFYNQFNQQQEEQEEGERMLVAKARTDMDHKAGLALVRSLEQRSKVASSFSEGARTMVKIVEGPKWKAPFAGLALAIEYRKRVKEYDNSPYWVMLLLAIALDLADGPIITQFITIILKWFVLFPFLWGRGTWKVKVTCRIIVAADSIPFINWLPLSSIAVLYAWKKSAKRAREAKEKLKKLERDHKEYEKLPPNQEAYAERITDYGDGRSEYEEYEEAYAQAA